MSSHNQVAVVTGAGSGIGAEISRSLATRGFALALVGRTREKLIVVADDIAAQGGKADVFVGDVGDRDGMRQVAADVRKRLGGVSALVNNAAVLTVKAFGEFNEDDVRSNVSTNLEGPFFTTQAFLNDLREAEDACIVNISSVAASVPRAGSALYGMTKAALEYLTKCLAIELASVGIRVNAVAAGPVDTAIHDSWLGGNSDRIRRLSDAPLGRAGQPQDIAWWVTELCCSNANWVTGAVIAVDGGKALGAAEPYA